MYVEKYDLKNKTTDEYWLALKIIIVKCVQA